MERLPTVRTRIDQDIYSMNAEQLEAHLEFLEGILEEARLKKLSALSWVELDKVRGMVRDCQTVLTLIEENVWGN